MYWWTLPTSPFVILGMLEVICRFFLLLMKNPLGKQCRPDQTPHDVASDLGLHCLFMALLRVKRRFINSRVCASRKANRKSRKLCLVDAMTEKHGDTCIPDHQVVVQHVFLRLSMKCHQILHNLLL